MSRIYSNDPLTSLPVVNVNWSNPWPPSPSNKSSKGVLLEGTISNRARFNIITPSSKIRYFVFYIKVRRAHRRVFDAAGKEAEPNFSETQKVRTGYLHSSYKTEAKGKSDLLSFNEVTAEIKIEALLSHTASTTEQGCVALWILESEIEGLEYQNGDEIRAKTHSSSPFIDSIAKLDIQSSATCNYAGGEQVGGSWTDKVFAVKTQGAGSGGVVNTADNKGAEDDEWD